MDKPTVEYLAALLEKHAYKLAVQPVIVKGRIMWHGRIERDGIDEDGDVCTHGVTSQKPDLADLLISLVRHLETAPDVFSGPPEDKAFGNQDNCNCSACQARRNYDQN